MTLSENYEAILPSIVAFIAKYRHSPDGSIPLAPMIFGTGFLIDEDGIVATNRHVVAAFDRIPRHPQSGAFGVAAVLFTSQAAAAGVRGLRWTIVELLGSTTLNTFSSTGKWFGENVPDIGIVQLKVKKTPWLRLMTCDDYVRIGSSIATCGFPLGDIGLTAMDKLNQLTPFLRRGIVSSVFPFGIARPHGFTIDIMQQGGSSGSPIFLEDQPSVVGMMASSLLDTSVVANETLALRVSQNTNISVAVPAFLIQGAVDSYKKLYLPDLTPYPTLDDYLANKPVRDGIGWEILNGPPVESA